MLDLPGSRGDPLPGNGYFLNEHDLFLQSVVSIITQIGPLPGEWKEAEQQTHRFGGEVESSPTDWSVAARAASERY